VVSLEGESSLSRAFGNRFDTTVVDEAAAVEDDGVDASRFRSLADHLANCTCPDALGRLCARAIENVLLQIAGCDQRPPSIVVDYLSVNVRGRPKHIESRSLIRAFDLRAHSDMASLARGQRSAEFSSH
jgi:hypothetical protein